MHSGFEFFSIVAAIGACCTGGDAHAVFFSDAPHVGERQPPDERILQARVGPSLRASRSVGRYATENFQHGERASHIVYLARAKRRRSNRVLTEASDRLRGQLVHADRFDGHARSCGRCGIKVQAQFLAAGAEGVCAGAGN